MGAAAALRPGIESATVETLPTRLWRHPLWGATQGWLNGSRDDFGIEPGVQGEADEAIPTSMSSRRGRSDLRAIWRVGRR